MTVEESGKALDALICNTMIKNEEKLYEPDMRDIAEGIKCDIDVTKDFFELIMHNYEDTNPKSDILRSLYFDTQTFGWVMFDRLIALAQQAEELVDMVIKNK